jgi:MFS family permease
LDHSAAVSFRRDARVIGLVGLAHGTSHLFQLALPPLFPLLRAEFGVSWTLLGALVGVFYAASGATQFAAGFVVDRAGARPVLFAGLALLATATLAGAFAPGVWWLFPMMAAAGIGNGVFHPADFAILNANVARQRLGHAYATHGIGGNLGYALAPLLSYGLGAAFGWRAALLIMGAAGLVVLGLIATQRDALQAPPHPDARGAGVRGNVALLLQWPLVMCFAYFLVQTMATVGLQTLAPGTLNAAFGVPLPLALSTVTAYVLGGAAGILAGGFLAARTARHDRVAIAGLASAAALTLVVAAGPAAAMFVPLFAAIGFAVGATGPSRDMIVRNATPHGASGRVYGFVYSGLDIGGTLGPVLFGLMLDHALSQQVFVVIALLYVVAIATVAEARRRTRAAVPAA